MKKRIGIWIMLLGSLVACAALVFAGVRLNGANSGKSAKLGKIITNVMQEAEPNTHVTFGAFDSMIEGDFQATPDAARAYSSASVFDAPRNYSVNITVDGEAYEKAFSETDEDEEIPLQSIPSFLSGVAAVNDALGAVAVTDRNGKQPYVSLAAVGDKITLSKPGGFSYGEVYRIELTEDAPYLCFEGKDPSIRVLTVEIEDDPAESAEYDFKQLRDGIAVIDRSKITGKRLEIDGSLYFNFTGDMPFLGKGDVFFATIDGHPDERLDFYGVVVRVEKVTDPEILKKTDSGEDVWHVVYMPPKVSDVYRYLRLRGVQPLNLEGATVLLSERLVLEQFRNSSLAFALGKMMAEEFDFTPEEILNFMNEVDLSVNLNFVGNRMDCRITLELDSFKIGDGAYFAFAFSYETSTAYSVDYDVNVRDDWTLPFETDYKVKTLADSRSAYYFKAVFDENPIASIPADADYTARIGQEIAKCRQGESNAFDVLDGERTVSATGGTRAVLPIFEIQSYQLSPLLFDLKVECTLDLGMQAMGLFRTESRTQTVDFSYSSAIGAGQSECTAVVGTGDWVAAVGGNARAAIGTRNSVGITLLGMYDCLNAESYAERSVGLTFSGVLGMNWNLGTGTFTGYSGADLFVTMEQRSGQLCKALLKSSETSNKWQTSLFGMNGGAALEKWSDTAATSVETNGKRIVSIGDDCLKFGVFDGATRSVKETAYQSDATFSVLSGLLCPAAEIDLASGSVFTYTSNNPELIEVDEKGTVRVKEGAPNEFTATFTVSVDDWAGPVGDRVISLHFVAGDTAELYVGDTLIGDYRPGATVVLPEPEPIRGKEFERYSYKGHDYAAGDSFTVPAEGVVVLEAHYADLPSYRVSFYDGYNNLVGTDEVYRNEDATPPHPILRDSHMDPDLSFFGWDRSFTNVEGDLTVVGIYVKVD